MSDALQAPRPPEIANPLLFLRRWLANPLQMGSIVPSSHALCRRVAAAVGPVPDGVVLELGAGTGVISRALLAAGLPPERLVVVEIVPEMAAHLRRVLPGARVIEGDARRLPDLLAPAPLGIPLGTPLDAPLGVLPLGRVAAVVCGIPLVLLKPLEQRRFIDAIEAVAPGIGFLHFSYCVTSPLPWRRHRLRARREAWTPLNFPPASVWRYTPIA